MSLKIGLLKLDIQLLWFVNFLQSTQIILHYVRWFSRQNTKYSSRLLSFNNFFSFLGKGTYYRQTYLHQSWTRQAQYLQNRFPHSCQEQRIVEKGRQRGWSRSPPLQKNCQATFGSPYCHHWRKRATNFGTHPLRICRLNNLSIKLMEISVPAKCLVFIAVEC